MDPKRAPSFTPEYAIPPGETVLEMIESLGLSQAEFAERTGRPRKTINEIVNGKAAITPETALQFERVLGVPASFWSTLEQRYRAGLARQAEKERLESEIGWLREVPVKDLVRGGWVEAQDRPAQQVDAALRFFGVASVDAWRRVWGVLQQEVAFRESAAFQSSFGAVASWLRIGEMHARALECEPYDSARFKAALAEARALTREDPEIFCDELVKRCAAAGVAVLFVKELPKLRVCGATRWLGSDKASIQLTLRYRTNDHLWFTFFHEAGHILLHGKRSVFIEEIGGGKPEGLIGPQKSGERRRIEEEEEANKFASEFLIPSDKYKQLLESSMLSAERIEAFAADVGIAPGIVVGRLQHDRRIPYKTPLNSLKQKYEWTDE
jgi:HTH-type transcriptional regulator / antitoxin HigA